MSECNPRDLARCIDHTLLRPDADERSLHTHCRQAVRWNFYAVCIAPCHVEAAAAALAGTDIRVCTVIGFPLGSTFPAVKANEAVLSVEAGARELDVMINLSRLKSRKYGEIEREIAGITQTLPPDRLVKVILETGLLDDDEIRTGCRIAETAGARFVKTSSGFTAIGATLQAVRIMAETVGGRLGIKAAGGISDTAAAFAFLDAGATRIGSSRSLDLIGVRETE